MAPRESLQRVERWHQELGLLPVPLWPAADRIQEYVLLNGDRGNFCLDLTGKRDEIASRHRAWSADVGHYVSVLPETVLVQRWDQRVPTSFRIDTVEADLEDFHRKLEVAGPDLEESVIAHSLRIFGSLRATMGPRYSGLDALRAFLVLIACAVDDADRQALDVRAWGLSEEQRNQALVPAEDDWASLREQLVDGRPLQDLRPDLRLTLRHAAGRLFQEAHYAALFFDFEQLRFAGITPAPVRSKKTSDAIGVHFTPPSLVRAVVEEALIVGRTKELITVFDPACGSGEFLKEAYRQLRLGGFDGEIVLIGFDISSAACDMASFSLEWETRGDRDDVAVIIEEGDSLDPSVEWPLADYILMNPPFRSWEDMSRASRERLGDILGGLLTGKPDMSAGFVVRAVESLARGGVLASVLPASFLDNESLVRVRQSLSEVLEPRLVARLGSQSIFPGATVDAGLYVAVKGKSKEPAIAVWSDHRPSSLRGALRHLRKARLLPRAQVYPKSEDDRYSLYETDLGTSGAPWAPRPYRQWLLLQELDHLPRVAQIFSVKQGIRTGLNRAFLVPKERWSSLPRSEKRFFRPAVVNDSIEDGILSATTYVFYPHGETDLPTEDALKEAVPEFYSHLSTYREKLVDRARIDESNWWKLSEHRKWLEEKTVKIVSTYFGGAGSFAWDSEAAFVVVQGFAWIPQRKDRRKNRPVSDKAWLAYLLLLNSKVFSDLLAAVSNHVGGGQWNLSKRFVEQLPLPRLDHESVELDLMEEAASLGARIRRSGFRGLDPEEREAAEEISRALFGIR